MVRSVKQVEGYPAMTRAGDGDVVGEVYEVDLDTLAALDRFEGHPDVYRRTGITLDDRTEAEGYLLPGAEVPAGPIISSGSWRTHRKFPT